MSGSADLAAALYERHGRSVRQYLRALTGSVDVAEDLAQDVFLRVVRHAHGYEPRERERAWLFRIARNAALDHHRRAAARPTPGDQPAVATVQATQSVRLGVKDALARLPGMEREALLLAELGGLSYAEIGAALGVTVPAVRSLVYRARVSLRASLLPPDPLPAPVQESTHDR